MREIKFRAWDNQKHEMIEKAWHVRGFHILKYTEGDFIPMQYTGARDDNGIEIYEGDLCTLIDGRVLAVEWNDDVLRWQFSDGEPLNDGDNYSAFKVVAGNIYENPELLSNNQPEAQECDARNSDSSNSDGS